MPTPIDLTWIGPRSLDTPENCAQFDPPARPTSPDRSAAGVRPEDQ